MNSKKRINKLILFDWGNIVESHTSGFSCKDAFEELFKECGYIGDEVVFNSLSKYEITAIHTYEEFKNTFQDMKKEFGLKVEFEEFAKKYEEIFDKIDMYEDVRDYEISLNDKCYIGIFSNLTIFDKKRLDKQVGLKNYDYVFLSFEMGCRKPDIIIFEKIQSKIPFRKEDILFIDDKEKNIKAAKEFGWNTLCATGLELDRIKDVCNSFINS